VPEVLVLCGPEGTVQNNREFFPCQICFGPETKGHRLHTQDGLTLDETRRFPYSTTGDENCFHRLTFEHGVAALLLLMSSWWVSQTACPLHSPQHDAMWRVREARC
jgi:hypothetical protein